MLPLLAAAVRRVDHLERQPGRFRVGTLEPTWDERSYAAAVEAVLAWARRGPPAARVTDVTTRPATGELDRPYQGFDWLPSA